MNAAAMNISLEIRAAQEAYAGRPFAVRWVSSYASITNRFHTLDEAYAYVQQMWVHVQKHVRENCYSASNLSFSYLETPASRVQLNYVLLCSDVSSY